MHCAVNVFTLSPCTYPVSRLNPSVLCYFARRFHDTEEVFCHAAFWALIWRVRLSVGDQSLGHGNNASFQETHPCSAADARLPVQYVRKTKGNHAETTRGAQVGKALSSNIQCHQRVSIYWLSSCCITACFPAAATRSIASGTLTA